MAGGAEGKSSRSRPWNAGGMGAALALMRLSILAAVEAGWQRGWDRRVDVPLALRYSENGSCRVSCGSCVNTSCGKMEARKMEAHCVGIVMSIVIFTAHGAEFKTLSGGKDG